MEKKDLYNIDELLNLEDEFYYNGLRQGSAENIMHSFTEGKQYGLQVGFQRYLLLGQIAGMLEVLETLDDGPVWSEKIGPIRDLLNGLRMDNENDSVADYEDRVIKIKNRFRTILLMLRKQLKNTRNGNALLLTTVERVSLSLAQEVKGYVKRDSEEGKGITESLQNQVQDW